MSIYTILQAWDRFWFSEVSPLSVAVYRILLGCLTIAFILLLIPDLFVWFGSHGMCSNQAVADWNNGHAVFLNLFSFFPDNDQFLVVFQCVFFCAAVALTLGFHARVAATICYLCLTSLYHRNPFIFNAGDTYLRVSTFWLIFSASGNALAITGRKQRSNPEGKFNNYKKVSIWPLRLLQIQLATVYWHTFFCKIVGGPWIDGSAVFTASRIEDLQRLPLPYVFEHTWTINLLTWGTLGIEGALFTLIWIKEFRYWVIAFAVIFHLTIEYHMNIPLFEWLMIVSYILFFEPEHLACGLTWLRNKFTNRKVTSRA